MDQVDQSTPIGRFFRSIAADCVAPLREASDEGRMATPTLVLQVQELVAKELTKAAYLGIPDDLC